MILQNSISRFFALYYEIFFQGYKISCLYRTGEYILLFAFKGRFSMFILFLLTFINYIFKIELTLKFNYLKG
ncbi:hypothetical protein BACPLE_00042 [Phocaeicola plebeius DSM 17135]|uniref:Uncharacterized protein n=1 Tax=Phocaeicola plebeius (strain DSM 17135 / JCM 12973 / CCUG 54634 / M2) TaxID=484018 RepID=B5CU08_PHOPM|nr:hypothetical protein BACPLE_00042 [Phocaeicola plebeius DSM 17135]